MNNLLSVLLQEHVSYKALFQYDAADHDEVFNFLFEGIVFFQIGNDSNLFQFNKRRHAQTTAFLAECT